MKYPPLSGMLDVRLLLAYNTVKELMQQITEIENNPQMPVNQKLSEIKKIREELGKVGTEIDSLKQEIKLLSEYRIN